MRIIIEHFPRIIAISLMALLVSVSAGADMATGMQAAQLRDYPTAFNEFMAEAKAGNPRGQAMVANMYRRGLGTTRSYKEAAAWYLKAAEQGDAVAQYNLGISYRDGIGVQRNDTAALEWYRKAAVQGFTPAQINLGLRYANGRGVEQDDVRGFAWLHLAASRGDRTALEKRNALARRMTKEQVEAGAQLARTLY